MRHQVTALVGTPHMELSRARTSPAAGSAARPARTCATTRSEGAAATARLMSSRADRSPCGSV